MEYKIGQSYLLPVKEVITENKRTFYKVEANGKEHNILLFDFQKDDFMEVFKTAFYFSLICIGEPAFH